MHGKKCIYYVGSITAISWCVRYPISTWSWNPSPQQSVTNSFKRKKKVEREKCEHEKRFHFARDVVVVISKEMDGVSHSFPSNNKTMMTAREWENRVIQFLWVNTNQGNSALLVCRVEKLPAFLKYIKAHLTPFQTTCDALFPHRFAHTFIIVIFHETDETLLTHAVEPWEIRLMSV